MAEQPHRSSVAAVISLMNPPTPPTFAPPGDRHHRLDSHNAIQLPCPVDEEDSEITHGRDCFAMIQDEGDLDLRGHRKDGADRLNSYGAHDTNQTDQVCHRHASPPGNPEDQPLHWCCGDTPSSHPHVHPPEHLYHSYPGHGTLVTPSSSSTESLDNTGPTRKGLHPPSLQPLLPQQNARGEPQQHRCGDLYDRHNPFCPPGTRGLSKPGIAARHGSNASLDTCLHSRRSIRHQESQAGSRDEPFPVPGTSHRVDTPLGDQEGCFGGNLDHFQSPPVSQSGSTASFHSADGNRGGRSHAVEGNTAKAHKEASSGSATTPALTPLSPESEASSGQHSSNGHLPLPAPPLSRSGCSLPDADPPAWDPNWSKRRHTATTLPSIASSSSVLSTTKSMAPIGRGGPSIGMFGSASTSALPIARQQQLPPLTYHHPHSSLTSIPSASDGILQKQSQPPQDHRPMSPIAPMPVAPPFLSSPAPFQLGPESQRQQQQQRQRRLQAPYTDPPATVSQETSEEGKALYILGKGYERLTRSQDTLARPDETNQIQSLSPQDHALALQQLSHILQSSHMVSTYASKLEAAFQQMRPDDANAIMTIPGSGGAPGMPNQATMMDMVTKAYELLHLVINLRGRVSSGNEDDMDEIRRRRYLGASFLMSKRPVASSKPSKRTASKPPPGGRCHSCNISETPEWRRGPDGKRTLCNACGLHYAKMTRLKKEAAVRARLEVGTPKSSGAGRGLIPGSAQTTMNLCHHNHTMPILKPERFNNAPNVSPPPAPSVNEMSRMPHLQPKPARPYLLHGESLGDADRMDTREDPSFCSDAARGPGTPGQSFPNHSAGAILQANQRSTSPRPGDAAMALEAPKDYHYDRIPTTPIRSQPSGLPTSASGSSIPPISAILKSADNAQALHDPHRRHHHSRSVDALGRSYPGEASTLSTGGAPPGTIARSERHGASIQLFPNYFRNQFRPT